jgi:hypothetical protein
MTQDTIDYYLDNGVYAIQQGRNVTVYKDQKQIYAGSLDGLNEEYPEVLTEILDHFI